MRHILQTVPGLGSRGEVLEILEDGGNPDWLLAKNAGGVRGWVPRSGVSGFSDGGGGGEPPELSDVDRPFVSLLVETAAAGLLSLSPPGA